MGVRHRAFLYLTRNKKKAVILLAILTFITTLVLLCTAVGNAADASVRKLREQMGGYFKIETDFTQGKFGRIDDTLLKNVVDAGGIKAVNGMDLQYFITEDLKLLPGRFTAEGNVKAKLARFLGNTNSSLNEYFMLEYYLLTDGRHVAPDDHSAAVISDVLAKENNLSVGDVFKVRYNEENLTEEQRERITSHMLEVVGIYHIDYPQGYQSADSAECDIEENFIFTDTAFIREVYGEAAGAEIDLYTAGAAFFVENPKELDGIMGRLLESADYNWEEYVVVKNNKTYEDSAAPLERLSGLVKMMVVVIAVVSAVMLSLILFLWMRERMHEIGIYLSIGIRKAEIFRQQILENLLAAVIAFFLAWGISAAAAGLTGQMIADSFSKESAQQQAADPKTEETMELQICIGAVELLEIAGFGFLIVLLSTSVSSVAVLRMQPKDILAKMS